MTGERESVSLIYLVCVTAVILALVIFFGLRAHYAAKELDLSGHTSRHRAFWISAWIKRRCSMLDTNSDTASLK